MDQLTVYAVFFYMDDDVPDVYCLDEAVARQMASNYESGDYILLQVSEQEWMSLLRGER